MSCPLLVEGRGKRPMSGSYWEGMTMHAVRLLADHSVVTRRQWDGRELRVYALDEGTRDGEPCEQWVDMTGWGLDMVRRWLGY